MTAFYTDEFYNGRVQAQIETELLVGQASEPMVAGNIVAPEFSKYRLASPIDGVVAGVCVTRIVGTGESFRFLPHGLIELPTWLLLTGEPYLSVGATYFLDHDGMLTTSPPNSGYLVRVGEAKTATAMLVDFAMKVKLN